MALLLSQKIGISFAMTLQSLSCCLIQSICEQQLPAAMYSASAELSAAYLCFLLYPKTTADPNLKFPPNVLFKYDGLPTQSASMKPHSFTPYVCLYHSPNQVVPLRYHKICLAALQNNLVGLTIAWLSWLIAQHISTRVFTRYISEPTSVDLWQHRICPKPQNLQGGQDTCILEQPKIVLGNSTRRRFY